MFLNYSFKRAAICAIFITCDTVGSKMGVAMWI